MIFEEAHDKFIRDHLENRTGEAGAGLKGGIGTVNHSYTPKSDAKL